ncbi:MAG TPA: RNA-binding protein [Terriglobales bacterium]
MPVDRRYEPVPSCLFALDQLSQIALCLRTDPLKNIFVGNLSFHTTEADLRTAFEPYGAVSRISIMTDRDTGRSRGFGFVEMEDDAQGDAAINALNGSEVDGRALNVNVARPRPERSGNGGGPRGGRGFGGGGGGGGRRENRW